MRLRLGVLSLAGVLLATVVSAQAGSGQGAPGPGAKAGSGPAVVRIAYWTTRPGKGAEARAFWKQFVPVFDEMKAKGLLLDYLFVTPVLHTGQNWDLAYLWICPDAAGWGRADAYFNAALGKMDETKIDADFEAAFDGSTHRDEVWEEADVAPGTAYDAGPRVISVKYWTAEASKSEEFAKRWAAVAPAFAQMRKDGLLLGYHFYAPLEHNRQDWDLAWTWEVKDVAAYGAASQAFRDAATVFRAVPGGGAGAIEPHGHHDELWKVVEIR